MEINTKMNKFAALTALIFLSGCASSYKIPNDHPSASVSFDLTSDSTNTTSKGFNVFAYDDLNCIPSKHGSRIDWKWPANDREILGPASVAAGVSLTFAVLYGESRIAQNRNCSFTASFNPLAGQTYLIRFVVTNQSLACGIQITDSSGTQVAYQAPENSCAETFAGKVKNGGAGILDWKVRVVR
ncbi:MAG: hypothetical protein HYS18_14510 [Burkholderiales bacterium]|nr:hypothetical protein [Burkholderiales bacterium]